MKKDMSNKLGFHVKHLFMDNLVLKIISILIAFMVWFIVVDINDPIVTVPYTLKVTAINANSLEKAGRTGRIDEEYSTVKVKVRAPRSRQKNIIADVNLTAQVDLSQLLDLYDDQRAPLVINCDLLKSTDEILTTTYNIPVIIEDMDKKSFPIKVNVTGEPGNNYEIGTCKSNPEQIAISGPKSILAKINTVEATVDVGGLTQSGNVSAPIRIIDKNGDVLREPEMETLRIDGNRTMVDVAIELWEKRSGIQLNVDYSGEPADGYQVSDITISPEDITVAGSEEALQMLDEQNNTITISGNAVSIDNASTDKEFVINLQDYLPDTDEIKLSSQSESVVVTVSILPLGSRQFEIPVDQIQTEGLGENLNVGYNQKNIAIRVKASDEKLEQLDVSQIKASVNLQGLTAGDHTVPVVITLPEGYQQVDQAVIDIHLSEKVEK